MVRGLTVRSGGVACGCFAALAWCALYVSPPVQAAEPAAPGALRAGAAVVDATPAEMPVLVNGMFESRSFSTVIDPPHVRCLVLEEGGEHGTRIAIAVVDSCMMPRELLDAAKAQAEKSTGIPADHVLISATHSHSCPAAMGCLGTEADPRYVKFLPGKIAAAIKQAAKNLAPAKVGWASIDALDYTHCRRWVFRPDRLRRDPFGELSVRANMHPGYQSADAISPTGPVDPGLSVLSVQTADGKPLAVLANYSMHYFRDPPGLSADYYGLFCQRLAKAVGADASNPAFVAIMSQGTSGDLWWGDYSQKQKSLTIEQYADGMVALAKQAYNSIRYQDRVPLAMKETKLRLRRRVADEKRLAWAREEVAKLDGKLPKGLPQVYAREQVMLAEEPERELKLQAIRIGELGIAAIPNEVYALTGLKIKARSPLPATFTMELANGSEGYIPPPEQHVLGGYTTWAARTAGLEVQAEPKILEAVLGLLEEVSGKPRRKEADVGRAYADAVAASKPAAWWPMGEMDPSPAADASGNHHAGHYEPGVVFALDGPTFPKSRGEAARAAHFAGGRMRAAVKTGRTWSAEFWFWNGLAANARPVTGYLFSRGPDAAKDVPKDGVGEHLGIGGTAVAGGKLIFFNGNALDQVLVGTTEIPLRTWNHVVLVREGKKVAVYLNGNKTPEIEGEAEVGLPEGESSVFVGGRSDGFANLEGRICEAAVYDRALSVDEVAAHYAATGLPRRPNAPPAADGKPKPTAALSPADSLKALHVREGFTVELVASEPLIESPVAFSWGADGKLWVVEMIDYPSGLDGKMKSGGRIRYLESTHNDGRYDKSTIFLDGVNFPTGILPWRKGVIVTAAPEIFYAEDSAGGANGGKADVRKTLYSGFKEGNTQLRVNGLRWGVDGWVYCANGWSGGVVRSEKTGQTVDLNGHDFRIKPDEGLIELQSGMSEFGRNCDSWGDWFGCDNSNPLFHFPLDDRYLRRNPYISPPPAKVQLETPANPKVYARSTPQKRYHTFEHSDHFTSACSAMIYRDNRLFPDDGENGVLHAFTCEPVHNLVHHEIVRESGVTFTAARPEEEKESEFLASEDQWFRPVMVRTGPDGALWVADMYRYVIEHPDWLPPQGKSELARFWRLGEERGRIYRVSANGEESRTIRRIDGETTKKLVELLGSANGWERDTAQQLLVWRQDPAAVPALEQHFAGSDAPALRMAALCTLDLLGALKPEVVEKGLGDKHPAVRRQALRLAETRAKDAPQLIAAAAKLVDDGDAKVRLQLACTLGQWDEPRAGEPLAKLAVRDADDPFIAGAVMSSALKHYPAVAAALATSDKLVPAKLMQDLFATALGVGNRDVTAKLVESFFSPRAGRYTAAQLEAFRGWLDTLSQHNSSLTKLRDAAHDALSERLSRAGDLFAAAREIVADASRSSEERAAAAELLGREPGKEAADLPRLAGLLAPQAPGDVQLAAVRALGKTGSPRVPELLTEGWASHSPRLKNAAIDVLIGREAWAADLLKAIESGKVSRRDLDLPRRTRLLNSRWAAVKAAAAKLGEVDPQRQAVVEAYRPALSLEGDAGRGKKLFAQNCATCHRLEGVGQEIGPNLLSVSGWTPEALLVALLDPNRQVEPRYLAFNATLTDGETVFGVVTAESPASITIKGLDGKERTILRTAIKTLAGTDRSLMPDGLEAALSKQDVADVMRYLRSSPGGK